MKRAKSSEEFSIQITNRCFNVDDEHRIKDEELLDDVNAIVQEIQSDAADSLKTTWPEAFITAVFLICVSACIYMATHS